MRLGIRIGVMRKAHRDISKLIPKLVIDKNGHQRKVYVRIELPEKKVEKEPWGSSTEKAKNLTIEDFGTLDEVWEMAKPIRTANGREEAKKILREIARKGALTSRSGITASLSGKSVDKIISGQASRQSFNEQAHWQAAANADKLFHHAIEPWKFELVPGKNNENLKNRRYLFAPMDYKGAILPVKFTIKEYKQQGIGKRIYSLEAIDVEIKQAKGAGH